MKLYILSDLHIEHNPFIPKRVDADVCILGGDISTLTPFFIDQFTQLLEQLGNMYSHVIYIPGNHEYYGTTIEDGNAALEALISPMSNVHLLNNSSVLIDGYTFSGGTLWSDLFNNNPLVVQHAIGLINDFRYISPDKVMEENKKTRDFIIDQCKNIPREKHIVITHFLPDVYFIDNYYKQRGGLLNYYFSNIGLLDEIKEFPILWIYGHTHTGSDTELFGSRFICNPRGYKSNGEKNFQEEKVVEIP